MLDPLGARSLRTFEHRHSDGSWGTMEPAHDDPAWHDPETGWKNGVIYVCRECDEAVRVVHPEDDAPTA
jgi:hypothetical protein